MRHLLHEGGIGAWFVLLFGATALASAALFAWRPHEARLGALRALSWTTAFSALAGFVAGAAKTLAGCSGLPPELRPRLLSLLLKGLSESMAILILGFALLALSWLVVAIGLRRLAVRDGAAA